MGSNSDRSEILSNIKIDTIRFSGNRNTIQIGTNNISVGQGRDIKIQIPDKDNLKSSEKEV